MQKLLKFATSPSNKRRGRSQNGVRRGSRSVDLDDCVGSPPKDLKNKSKVSPFATPEQSSTKGSQDRSAAMSPRQPPSPSEGGSICDSSLLSPPLPLSPASSESSPPPVAHSNAVTTPTKSRRKFFSSNRFSSLDDPSSRCRRRANLSAESTPPATSPSVLPQNTPPFQWQRTAVQLSNPIRLLSPKHSGGVSATVFGYQTGHKSTTDFGDLEYMNKSNEGYKLTVEQCELVRQAWRCCHAEQACDTAGAWIFKRIFAKHPHLKRLFNLHELKDERALDADSHFQKHARVFTDVLEMVVDSIDALDDGMGPLLLSYGSKHVQFESGQGFRPEYWDAFAVAMTEYASNNWKFPKKHHRKAETLSAWRILVFFIVSKVKQGFTLEKMAREKRRLDSCSGDESQKS